MLRNLEPANEKRLLIDASTGDDAAVWLLDADRALVVTADFITPLVDDARTWGRIAAANAVSDIYAMGAKPLLALNLVAWNKDELPLDMLAEVLAGADDIAKAGRFVVAGGHTVDDPIPKFGLAVVGESHPDRLLTNAGLKPAQDLILTKPLGIGILSTAIKRGIDEVASEIGVTDLDRSVAVAVESMTRLNDEAAAAAVNAGATGATDVTGFGLLGHLGRAATESSVDVIVEIDRVPILPGVRSLAKHGLVPGGSRRNLLAIRPKLIAEAPSGTPLDEETVLLLADAQTSGGLVFACPTDQTASVMETLTSTGHNVAVIGRTVEPGHLPAHRDGTSEPTAGWIQLV